MKILFYINIMSDGGAERVMANLANYFGTNGNEVILVNSFPTENEYKLDKKVCHLYLEEKEIKQNFIKRNASRIKKLRGILKREKPDIAVAFMLEPNFRLIAASCGLKLKTLVSVRNDPARENEGMLKKNIATMVLRLADGVVFQTSDAQGYYKRSVTEHSRIIFNPVKDSIYDIAYSGERKDIVTAGRLSEQKNQLMLINAYAKISQETTDRLIIYGEGTSRDILQKRIDELEMNDRIFLAGNSDRLHEDIKSAKMFVFPSDYEGMPNALMEAMALGLPCISTDCPCGGPKMIIEDGKNGFLVPVSDTDALADKMRYLLAVSENERTEIGKNAKETAKSFKADKVCREWKMYFEELVDGQ